MTGLFKDVAAIIAECVKTPGHVSIWSERLGEYVCTKDPHFEDALRDEPPEAAHAISPEFKLVVLISAIGTLLFVVICVVTTIIAGRDMPPAWEKLVQSLLDLAKVGVGAFAGLLG